MEFINYYQKHFNSKTEARIFFDISRPLVYKLLRGQPVGLIVARKVQERSGGKLRALKMMGVKF
jgi:hypothetical protein